MKKIIIATFVALSVLCLVSTATFANMFSVKAENGKILRPTGISIDAGGNFATDGELGLNSYRAELGYGAFSSITISGAYEKDGEYERLLAKAYVSPIRNDEGYTLYAGYDLNNAQLAMVGASLWMNYKYLFGFLNVESDVDRLDHRSIQITPGFSFRVTPKFRIVGEAELAAEAMRTEELRAGVHYYFAERIIGKVVVEEEKGVNGDTVIQTGLSVEI